MTRKLQANPLIVVLGATGTGKSQLAVDLATKYNGEIINGDAMQMYHGLPIITNKISLEEQKGIPHHLLSIVGLDEETWRVGIFKKNADRIIREIRGRGKLPILVGGTHYYTQSLLFERELLESAEDIPSKEITDRFPILGEDVATEDMVRRLREVDSVMAERWHPNDRRHIRRSLEIFLTTGKQASEIYKGQRRRKEEAGEEQESGDESMSSDAESSLKLRSSALFFWVHAEDKILKARLDARVDNMMEMGLLEEVKSLNEYLRKQNEVGIEVVDTSRGIWVSIGFKEFEKYLAAARDDTTSEKDLATSLRDSIEQTKAATRRYAKRQVRWIRSKLMAALLEAKAVDNLYLLDGSDISLWTESVSNPALQVAGDFLAGAEMQLPSSLSPAAAELLNTDEASKKVVAQGVPFREECELCNMVFVVEQTWAYHAKTRTHRRMLKRAARRSGLGRDWCSKVGES